MKVERLQSLDVVRGAASLMVVLHHIHWVSDISLPVYLSPVRTHFGLGVPLFFLLSSFTMYMVYFSKAQQPGFTGEFIVRRYARLLPLYITMIIVWVAAYYLAYGLWMINPTHIVLYATLLFSLVPDTANGLVPAAWSIGVEMLFYLSFPVMIVRLRSIGTLTIGCVIALGISLLYQVWLARSEIVIPYNYAVSPLLYAPFFFAGAILYLAWREGYFSSRQKWVLLAGSMLVLTISSVGPTAYDGTDPILYWTKVMLMGPALAAVVAAAGTFRSQDLPRALTSLGEISYSIYLIHVFVIYFGLLPLVPFIREAFPTHQLAQFLIASAGVFVVLIPLSILSHRFIEIPSKRFIECVGRCSRPSSSGGTVS